MKTWLIPYVLMTALALCAAPPAAVAAPPGSLIITDHRLDPGSPDFEKERKEATGKLKRAGDGWRVYFVAYLKKTPGVEEMNIVFYEAGGTTKEPVNFISLRTKPNAKIMVADVEIKPEDGFKAGRKYNVRITRLISGREDVYASTVLELAE